MNSTTAIVLLLLGGIDARRYGAGYFNNQPNLDIEYEPYPVHSADQFDSEYGRQE